MYYSLYYSAVLWFYRLQKKSMVYNFTRWPTRESRVSNHLMHVFFYHIAALDRNVEFAQSYSRYVILLVHYKIPRNVQKQHSIITICLCLNRGRYFITLQKQDREKQDLITIFAQARAKIVIKSFRSFQRKIMNYCDFSCFTNISLKLKAIAIL